MTTCSNFGIIEVISHPNGKELSAYWQRFFRQNLFIRKIVFVSVTFRRRWQAVDGEIESLIGNAAPLFFEMRWQSCQKAERHWPILENHFVIVVWNNISGRGHDVLYEQIPFNKIASEIYLTTLNEKGEPHPEKMCKYRSRRFRVQTNATHCIVAVRHFITDCDCDEVYSATPFKQLSTTNNCTTSDWLELKAWRYLSSCWILTTVVKECIAFLISLIYI